MRELGKPGSSYFSGIAILWKKGQDYKREQTNVSGETRLVIVVCMKVFVAKDFVSIELGRNRLHPTNTYNQCKKYIDNPRELLGHIHKFSKFAIIDVDRCSERYGDEQ